MLWKGVVHFHVGHPMVFNAFCCFRVFVNRCKCKEKGYQFPFRSHSHFCPMVLLMFDKCLIHVDSLGVEMPTFILESLPRFLIDSHGFNKIITYIDIVRMEAYVFFLGGWGASMRSNGRFGFRKGSNRFRWLGRRCRHGNCAAPNELEWILIANKWLIYVVFLW